MGNTTNFILPLVAYYNRDFRMMHIVAGLVGCVSLPMYFFLPESVHWLACNKRKEEAIQNLMVTYVLSPVK